MPSNDRDVFDYLTADDATPIESDYLTYAQFAFEKKQWIEHRAGETGLPPAQAEIDEWISNLTPYQFERMRDAAVNFFDEAARDYLAVEIQELEVKAMHSAIVREVKAASGFWRQFAMALVTAILAPTILGVVIWATLYATDLIPTAKDVSATLPTGP